MLSSHLEKLRDTDGFINLSGLPYRKRDFGAVFKLKDNTVFWKPRFNDSFSHFTEVLVSILARQVGYPCAHYDLAKLNEKEGVLSYNLIKKGEKAFHYYDFIYNGKSKKYAEPTFYISVELFYSRLKKKIKEGIVSKENAKELLEDYVKLMMFDAFTMNLDRHCDNFLIVKQDNHFKLSPTFDNEASFLSHYTSTKIHDILHNKEFKGFIKQAVYFNYGLVTLKQENEFDITSLENLHKTKQSFPKLYKKTLNQFLKMDVNEAFITMEKEQNITLPTDYKKFVSILLNTCLNAIEKIDSIHKFSFDTNTPTFEF